jgi:hypothetical protein
MTRSSPSIAAPRTRRWRRMRWIAATALLTASIASPVSADPPASYVAEWNGYAASALFNAGLNPPAPTPPGNPPGAGQPAYVGALHMAMVQLAVYDAVNAIEGGYQSYIQIDAAPSGASKDAAVVEAAHDVLTGLGRGIVPPLPAVTLAWIETEYEASIAEISAVTSAADLAAGLAAGSAAAAAILEARDDDGRYVSFFHPEGEDPGDWRPVTAGARDQFAWVGNVEPFMLNSPSQLRTDGPAELTSAEYTAEYNEVKDLGSASSVRTPAQAAIASFFQPNPIEMFNRNFRTIAEPLSVADEARLFARLNLAAADALISCWNDKSFHHFWRPITAIQQGDFDTNPDTDGDMGWTPLVPTPPYPDHSSGYNCATGSMMHAAADFFGNKFAFSIQRNPGGVSRSYTRFTDVIKDTIDARVLQGLHFRSADVQGANIGKHAAHWLDKYFLQPVD